MTRKGGERVEPSACGHVEHLDSVFGLGCSVKGCSNYIAIRKGGGRESGEQGTVHLKPDVSKGGPKLSGAYGSSAANPAALSPEVRKSIEEAIEANRPLIERVGLEVLLRVLFKAYRVLESENRILTDAMRKEIAKVRALEAELADVRKWLNATHANQQDLVMERNDAVARAEKAEARVKELEALPPGLHRHPPQTQACGCDNRTAADLRGEDRG